MGISEQSVCSLQVLYNFIDIYLFSFYQMSLFQAEEHSLLLIHPVEYFGISASCLPPPPAFFFKGEWLVWGIWTSKIGEVDI